MSSCSARVFRWSELDLTLRELTASYRQFIPFAIVITNECSDVIIPTPTASTVLWVHDLVKITQIVVEDGEGRRFMIPEILDKMVVPIQPNGKEGQAFPFREIRFHKEFHYISFEEPVQEVRNENAGGEKEFYPLTKLRVVDVCDEDMLVVHHVLMENMFVPSKSDANERTHHKVLPPQFKLLPSYLPIRASIALSLSELPDTIFFQTMLEMKQAVETYPHDYDLAKREAAEILLCASDAHGYVNTTVLERRGPAEAAIGSDFVPSRCGIDPETKLRQLQQFYESQDRSQMDSDGPVGEGQRDGGVRLQDTSNGKQPTKKQESDTKRSSKQMSWLRKAVQAVQPKQSRKSSLDQKQNRNSAPEMPLKETRLPHDKRHSVDSVVTKENKPERCLGGKRPIRNLADVPEDISGLSIEDISDCLELLNLSKYAPAMRKKKVDGRLLLCLGEEELKSIFGFSDFNATKLMQFSKCGWRPKIQQSPKHSSISKGLDSFDVRSGQHFI